MQTKTNVFYEVYECVDEENDEWAIRSSHMEEEVAEKWIMDLIKDNPKYEDVNFRVDECTEETLTDPNLT